MLSLGASDRTLVKSALEGDPSAVERLVFRYQRKAHAIARAIVLRSPVQVDDVVQESFFQALRDLRSLRRPERFGAWFLKIVRNVAHGRLTERRPVVSCSLPEIEVNAPDEVEFQELRSHLWREVASLPQGVREAIFLFYHEGESVRSVAATLGITRAATRKRLQKGRDLLRETLFRTLRDHLRGTSLPSSECRRRARRTSILTCALPWFACPDRVAAVVGASSSGAGSSTGSPVGALGGRLLFGGAEVTRNASASLGIVVLICAAVVTTLVPRNQPDMAPSRPEAVRRPAASPSRDQPIEPTRRGAVRTIGGFDARARGLDARLDNVPPRSQADRPIAGPTRARPTEGPSEIDFRRYSVLFAENLSLLGSQALGELSAGERESLQRLRAELHRVAAEARRVSEYPLFDQDLFRGLFTALFRDSLELSRGQLAELEVAMAALFERTPRDPGELDPLERLRWKEEMAHHLWDTMDQLLDELQLASWLTVREYTEQFFREGYVHLVGIQNARHQIIAGFDQLFSLDDGQRRAIEGWAGEYQATARRILARHAASDEELGALTPRRRRALNAELLELQRSYEARVAPLLRAQQQSRHDSALPHVLRFNLGRSSRTVFHGRAIF